MPDRIFNKDKLRICIDEFMGTFEDEDSDAERNILNKSLDPIIFSLDYYKHGESFDWKASAIVQATRKTRENRIGELHMSLIGLMPDWEKLPKGRGRPDVVNNDKKLISEVKSRSDTVKGSDQTVIYDGLLHNVTGVYEGYIGLYSFILNKTPKEFLTHSDFTPSESKKKQKRIADPRIRAVDGRILWAIASDARQGIDPPYSNINAILQVYEEVLEAILTFKGRPANKVVMNHLAELTKRNFQI